MDAAGYLVTPGLIDINTHIASGLKPDYNTLPYGVTTAVDQGTATCKTFPNFRKEVIGSAKVRALEFVSATDSTCTSQIVKENHESIAGIFVKPSTLEAALATASATGAVVMISGAETSGTLSAARQLRPGDISTQVYSRINPPLDSSGRIRPAVEEARRRGIVSDSGGGTDGLWFRVAQPAPGQKFLPDTISSGMDWNSILLPRATLSSAMSIFLNLGMSARQVTERVTSAPARATKRPQLGSLAEGGVADVAVLEVQEGKFGFLDSGHARLQAARRFNCVPTVRNGKIVWDSKGLSIPDTVSAGSYTNFK